MKNETAAELTVWTVGHSTRSADEFNNLLTSHHIRNLVDVRSLPGSRRHPQFNQKNLSESLRTVGIEHHHLPSLGGRRRPKPDSKNTAWQNASFRAYADHMESEEFAEGVKSLLELARQASTAIMCAEALWWRCHRGLVADYLKASGVNVVHIMGPSNIEDHPFTSAARIVDGQLNYEGLL
ncbi:MAG TPA: DUF488 domain-containing protein [Pyrinomonadaceae bacterium]|nr:DUF488 domain-containing protein [Pyrinomonadaceae bacterium]